MNSLIRYRIHFAKKCNSSGKDKSDLNSLKHIIIQNRYLTKKSLTYAKLGFLSFFKTMGVFFSIKSVHCLKKRKKIRFENLFFPGNV